MARASGSSHNANPGSTEKLDKGGDSPRRGDILQSPGDADVDIVTDSKVVGSGEILEPHDNGRGDGSEYYECIKPVIADIRTPWGHPDDPARSSYKRLMASLTDRQTPRGKSREVSRISLAATKLGFRATLTDYLISMKLTVEFSFLDELPLALEQGILGIRGSWVPVKQGEAWNKRKEDEKKKLANSDGIS